MNSYDFVVPFTSTETFREHAFRLRHIQLPGEGRYVIQVYRRVRGWQGRYWRPVASDEFWLLRESSNAESLLDD